MKEIPLTKGAFALVDDEDYEELSKYNWRYHNGYAARTTSRNSGKRTTVLMHRQVITDIEDGLDIDHINGNKSDNRKENLRLATRQENNRNTDKRRNNTSGYKGVGFDKRKNKWRARLKANNSEVFVGYFESKHDAARAYNEKAKEIYGDFARLNVIKEEENE